MTARILPLAPPASPPRVLADARHVVTHPDLYRDRPWLQLHAWAVLKTAQGKPLRQRGPGR